MICPCALDSACTTSARQALCGDSILFYFALALICALFSQLWMWVCRPFPTFHPSLHLLGIPDSATNFTWPSRKDKSACMCLQVARHTDDLLSCTHQSFRGPFCGRCGIFVSCVPAHLRCQFSRDPSSKYFANLNPPRSISTTTLLECIFRCALHLSLSLFSLPYRLVFSALTARPNNAADLKYSKFIST